MTQPLPVLLLIDDEEDRLTTLADSLRRHLDPDAVKITPWLPNIDEDPFERFQREADGGVRLVATDQDLTRSRSGLLGTSIASWAQDRYIPVCNFSRHPQRKLPRERNFFEIRVPSEATEDNRAAYIARIFSGFESLRAHVEASSPRTGLAQLLAEALGIPTLVDDLTPFVTSVGLANASLLQGRRDVDRTPSEHERVELLAFMLGHTLLNAVLEFPGPIIDRQALAAYCATGPNDAPALASLFADAEFTGPFAEPGGYFIKSLVDERIDSLAESLDTDATDDQYNRVAVESALGELHPHGCDRYGCGGTRGGFWCPFVARAVCDRSDCSVQASAWIPRGASLCRVEKDYFDEWSPLLGG